MLEEHKKQIDRVVYLQAEDQFLEERVVGRLRHPASGRIYHSKFKPPKIEGKDDITGEPLMQDSRDTIDEHKKIMEDFHKINTPLLKHYEEKNLLARVDATKGIKDIWSDIQNIL